MSFIPGANVGPYRIVEQTERNGTATTYTAYQPSLGRYVLVVVLPTIPRDDVPLQRLRQRQLELIASLRHPNILTVLDHGEHLGIAFLVAELVVADTLTSRLGAPWPLAEVVRVLRPIAAALDYAHEQGIVHGDVRPSAIRVTEDGTPILAGFGLTVRPALAGAGVADGEPGRRAPSLFDEVTRGQQADRRGLALIAYEMLTGRVVDVAASSFDSPLPPAQLGSPLLTRPVEAALLRELAGEPAERYPTASALLTDLAATLTPAAPLPPPSPPSTAATADEGRTRWPAVVLVFAAVAVLGIIVVLARGGLLGRPVAPVAPPVAATGTAGPAGVEGTSVPAAGTTPGQPATTAGPAAAAQASSESTPTLAGMPAPTATRGGPTALVPTPDAAVAPSTPAAGAPAGTAPGSSAPGSTAPAATAPGGTVAGAPTQVPLPTPPPTLGMVTPATTAVPARIPPSWRTVGEPSGRWSFDEQGRIVGHVEDGASLLLFPETVEDVDYSAQVSTTTCQATLVFRVQDEDNLMMAIYIPDGLPNPGSAAGGVWLYQRVEGLDIPIRAVRPPTVRPAGEPVRLRIVTNGPRISLTLDDQPVMQAVDTAPRAGRLGLTVYSTGGRVCEATFADISR